MTGDQHGQDEDAGNVERFRVLVGARLAKLGAPLKVTTVDAQIEDTEDDVDGHAWSVKQD